MMDELVVGERREVCRQITSLANLPSALTSGVPGRGQAEFRTHTVAKMGGSTELGAHIGNITARVEAQQAV